MYYVLLFILKLFSRMPFRVLYAISDLLYFPLYYVVRYRRRIVRRNLAESFPEKSQKEIRQIEKQFYHFFIDVLLESSKLLTISFDEIQRRAYFKNLDLISAELEAGRDVSVFIGHYANWEWICTAGLQLGKQTHLVQIYHQLSNKYMERIVLYLRERFGNKSVLRHETVRYIINASKEGRRLCIGFIADQSPKRREAKHFLSFLNHNIPVLTGTEKLVKHFGHTAFYLSAKRIRRGFYEYELSPLCDDPKSLPDYELTRLYFERLERDIRHQPELYLWTHNRFKYAVRAEGNN